MRRTHLLLSAVLVASTAACSSHNAYSNAGAAQGILANLVPATSAWGANHPSTLPTGVLASFNPPQNAWPATSKPGPANILSFVPPMKAWQDVQK